MSAICGFWTLHGADDPVEQCRDLVTQLQSLGPDRASVYPYPAAGAPYPAAGAPYPAAGAPDPAAGAPDPAAGAPYPAAGAPYPARGATGPMALGHTLRAITPEDQWEAQPLVGASHTAGTSCWMVADARLDNRAELAEWLGIHGADAVSLPDSVYLLRAWQRWGQDCVARLTGGFAFAVWEPIPERLFLARDHAGERTLHYRVDSSCFAFATTTRALRALADALSDLDQRQLVRDLMGIPPDPGGTRFRGIHAVPAGHCVIVERGVPVVRRYWNVESLHPIRFRRDQDYVEAFRDIFDEAVRCRLRTTGGIATELSAGLDSGAVTATAARLLAASGRTLDAYTAVPCPGFAGPVPQGYIADEGPYAAEVAAMYANITHHCVDMSGSDMLRELARIFPLLDIPHAAPLNNVWGSMIHDHAAASGANVMLCGALGNFTVSYTGADLLYPAFRSGHWLRTLRLAATMRRMGLSSGRNAASQTLFALLPWWLRRRVDPLIRAMGLAWTGIHPQAATRYGALDQMRRYGFVRHTRLPHLMETQFLQNQYGDYNTATLAGWGIETRDPTADRRVFEFCAAIPPEQFVVGGQGRSLIRRSMQGRLPQATLDRREKGTQAADWYEALTPIRAELAAELTLMKQCPEVRSLIDVDLLSSAVDAWPATAEEAAQEAGMYQSALPRGVAVGSFIRRIEQQRAAETQRPETALLP